ncbi:MAG: saccharopine dehydrogenase NADP-binding domain-containing protein [Cyanobacteria bacterium P01_F01_bin.150]
MNVLVLGGAGLVGRQIVAAIANNPLFSQITIGERNIDEAQQLAQQFGDNVSASQLDISDAPALEAVLTGCDIVVSCVGPYYKFGKLVLSAAINAGKHYIDICDDWEPTLEMLALSETAQAADVSAIVGMGASPGTTNLLAVLAHNALDRVDTLYTIWGVGDMTMEGDNEDEEPTSDTALEHWLLQASGTIRVKQNGMLRDVIPLEEYIINFPSYGRACCYSLGHPEPVTLPLTFPNIRESLNLMNMPSSVIGALKKTGQELDSGESEMPEAVQRLARRLGEDSTTSEVISNLNFMAELLADKMKDIHYVPSLCGMAIGEKDGKPARAGSWCNGFIPGGTGGTTGIPVVAVLEMMASGEITKRGVYAPEGAIDAKRYFDYLERYVTRPKNSANTPLLRIVIEKDKA